MDLDQKARELLDSLPDEMLESVLSKISLSMPWQLESEKPLQDADGFNKYPPGSLPMTSDELSSFGREDLLRECRNKADSNPRWFQRLSEEFRGGWQDVGLKPHPRFLPFRKLSKPPRKIPGTGCIIFGRSLWPGPLSMENSE